MSPSDIDLFEMNEAFASVVLRFMEDLGVDHSKTNVNGGAIAMGHPLGATGAMILGTVLDELERTGKSTGLATLCVGGGMGTATIIERSDLMAEANSKPADSQNALLKGLPFGLAIGAALGISLGVAFGVSLDNPLLGVGLGLAFGPGVGLPFSVAIGTALLNKQNDTTDQANPDQEI
jgi:hypothetical protein